CAPRVRVEPIESRGCCEEEQGLAEGVQLKLLPCRVAEGRARSRVARKVELLLVRYRAAGYRVRGFEPGPVVEEPVADKANSVVEHGPPAGTRDRLPRIALVADPAVPVVVVSSPSRALRKRHRGCGDHPAGAAREPGQDGVGMARVASPDSRLDRRHASAPALLDARPREVGRREVELELVEREHQHEIVCLTRLELEHERQHLAAGPVRLRSRAGAAEPREADLAAAARPRPALGASEVARRRGAEAAAWVQYDIESRRSLL